MSVKRYEWVACDEHSCHCDVVESTEGDMVDYEDYAALEARCAALAAENAGLKAAVTHQIELRAEIKKAGRPPHADFWVQSICEVEEKVKRALEETPATDTFLAEVRAQGVEEFLRGSQLPYQIATVLADYDNVDDATLQTVIWSGQPPEPDGDVWHLEYVSRGNAIVRAVLKELRKGVQS
ncbi:TPA: hypothetical protein ACNCEQ_004436 [Escherichia coli]|uniref:hypothetical protein n=1 Tax=Escherichia coli TaxID=562 RepID=UPI00388F9A39